MKPIYLIKDLSKISGCSPRILKFYLRLGLLKKIGVVLRPVSVILMTAPMNGLKRYTFYRGRNFPSKKSIRSCKGPMFKMFLTRTVILSFILNGLVFSFIRIGYSQDSKQPAQQDLDHIVGQVLDQFEEKMNTGGDQSPEDVIKIPEIIIPLEGGDFVETSAQEQAPVEEVIKEMRAVSLEHADPSVVVEKLNQLKSVTGEVTYIEEEHTLTLKDSAPEIAKMTAFIKQVDIPLETEVFQLKYADGNAMLSEIEGRLTKDIGKVYFDQKTDALRVTDARERIDSIAELIKRVDRVNKDVEVTSEVIEIVLNDEHVNGIDWEAIVSEYKFLKFEQAKYFRSEGQLNLGTVSGEDYDILVDALDTVGLVHPASRETVTIANAKEGFVSVSTGLLEDVEKGTQGLEVRKTPKDPEFLEKTPEEEKARFHLRPVIHKDHSITVFLDSQIRERNGDFSSRQKDQELRFPVGDENVIVIGGIFKEVFARSSWKIPLLGSIPLLGAIFRDEGKELRTSEIVLFLTINLVDKGSIDE